MVIKSLESVCKIGRELIFSVSISMMVVLFWFSCVGNPISPRRPLICVEEVSLSEWTQFFISSTDFLTLFRMGFFGAAHGWGEAPFPKICYTYPTMMKLGTNVPYLEKIHNP